MTSKIIPLSLIFFSAIILSACTPTTDTSVNSVTGTLQPTATLAPTTPSPSPYPTIPTTEEQLLDQLQSLDDVSVSSDLQQLDSEIDQSQ